MTLSVITKRYKAKWLICRVLSVAATFGPVIGFGIYALCASDTTTRLAITMITLLSMAIAVVNVMFKYSFRTSVYLILFAISIALEKMSNALIIVAVCTALDEFAFEPLAKHYREKFSINKEIDRREQP